MARLLAASGLLLCLTGIVTGGGAVAAAWSSRATPRHWRVESTPNPARADISFLSSVACYSQRACIAVGGSSRSLSSSELPLAERWDGARWVIQPTATPQGASDSLAGVSCPSARACVAVGGAFYEAGRRQAALIEAWNGRRWRVHGSPSIKAPSSLFGVSCVSADACVAVGATVDAPEKPIVERWDGKVWRIQATAPLAGDAQLLGVSCSGARACTAVGWTDAAGQTRPLVESWDGKRWRTQSAPLPSPAPVSQGSPPPQAEGTFEAVSCTSATACTATGDKFNDPADGPLLAERWNGKAWRIERTPNPRDWTASLAAPVLDGVSCVSASTCTAIGEYDPGARTAYFIESWKRNRWMLEPAPTPAKFAHGALLGIACRAARCNAVGAYSGGARLQVTLALSG